MPLLASDSFIRDKSLQGLSLREIQMTLYAPNGKKISTQEGDMIFTHFGLSGPAALRMGHYVSTARRKHGEVPLPLTIDLMPDKSADEIAAESWRLLEENPKKAAKNVLKGYLPERIIPILLSRSSIAEDTTLSHMRKQNWAVLAKQIKSFPLTITGTLSLEEAFITGGGVSVKEIDPRTMQSKLMRGLYFAGEVMDVHAHTGGYNITIAFSSGHAAGTDSARQAKELNS